MKKTILLATVLIQSTIFGQFNSGSLNFDGTDDFVNFDNAITVPTGSSPYTIECVVKLNTTSLFNRRILGWGQQTPNSYNGLVISPAGLQNYWWANDLTVSYTFNTSNWYHIAATWDGITRKLYVDGNLVGSDTPSSSINIVSTFGGIGDPSPGTANFAGSIDELRIWNIAKDSTELIDARYCEIDPNSPNLMSYFRFNSGINPGGNNLGVTALENEVTGAENGILLNFDLTGATSNWIQGADIYNSIAGEQNQTFDPGATIADLVLSPANIESYLLNWYPSLQDAINGTNELPTTTPLIDGSEYFVNIDNTTCPGSTFSIVATINSSAGINDQSNENQWSIFPNPSNGLSVVSSNQLGALLQIKDATGRLVSSKRIATEKTTIDLNEDNSGIYFISILETDGTSVTKKLIVRK